MACGKLHCSAPGCNATMDMPQCCGKPMVVKKGLFSRKLACAAMPSHTKPMPQHCGKPCS